MILDCASLLCLHWDIGRTRFRDNKTATWPLPVLWNALTVSANKALIESKTVCHFNNIRHSRALEASDKIRSHVCAHYEWNKRRNCFPPHYMNGNRWYFGVSSALSTMLASGWRRWRLTKDFANTPIRSISHIVHHDAIIKIWEIYTKAHTAHCVHVCLQGIAYDSIENHSIQSTELRSAISILHTIHIHRYWRISFMHVVSFIA